MIQATAFVTGAATGIGRALARRLDAEGWIVYAGVHRAPPDALLDGASPRLRTIRLDLADGEEIARAASQLDAELGPGGLGLLVNNAATAEGAGPLECLEEAAFRRLMEVNFWGPLRLTRALLPAIRRHGPGARIVMVGSASVYLTIPLGAPYPVSKHALTALAHHLRIELAPFGIDVTLVEPGGVETPMTRFSEEERRDLWAVIPAPLLAGYQAAFAWPGDALNHSFPFQDPASFADEVYRRVIAVRRTRPGYLIGRGIAFLPWMHRLLPECVLERLFKLVFRARRSPPCTAQAPDRTTCA